MSIECKNNGIGLVDDRCAYKFWRLFIFINGFSESKTPQIRLNILMNSNPATFVSKIFAVVNN